MFLMWCGPSWGLAGDAVPAPRTPPELLSRLRTLVRLFFLLCPLKTHKHWFLVYFNGFVSKTDMPSLGCGFPGIYVQQGLDSTSNTTSNTPVGTLPSPVDFPVCLTSQPFDFPALWLPSLFDFPVCLTSQSFDFPVLWLPSLFDFPVLWLPSLFDFPVR